LARYLLVLTLLVTALSCKTRKKAMETPRHTGTCNLRNKAKDTLLELLKKNEFKYEWLSARISASVTTPDSTEETFTVNMRARKDSAIWLSISKMGIEGARVLVTKDSVKFMSHLPEKRSFKGDYAYINKMLDAELDFEMLQSVLLGNSVSFYEDERYRTHIDYPSCQYLLSTIRKRKLKKVIEGNKQMREPVQSIWLNPANAKITRILFRDYDPDRTFDAYFDKFEAVDSTQLQPMLIKCEIVAQKRTSIKLEYNKVTLNKPQTFPFNIPSSYEPIIFKDRDNQKER
jgi:hypothetical protein